MTTIPLASPYSLKNATLSIDEDDYTAAVTQVEFTPSSSAATVRTIDGVAHRDQDTAEWSCALGLVQDLAPEGLLRYLLAHDGESKDAVFTPLAGGPAIHATLIISPAAIGGSTSSSGRVVGTATLAVDGKPEFVDPTTP